MFHRARVWLLLFNFLGSIVFAQTPPVITGALSARQVVAAGSDLALSFSVTGATGLQWMRNGRPIAGATNASVTITSVDYSTDSGWYHLVATNSEGTATSSTVFVNVAPRSPQVIGWGNNSYGSGQINVPANLTDAVAIAAGDEFSLALKADGKVVAWGDNSVGQTSVPSALADVVAIAAGTLHAMALRSDGSVTVWGANQAGERTVPAGLGNVVAIAGGGAHCLALKSDGTVVAWGYNNAGQATVPTGLTSVASSRNVVDRR